MGSARWMHDKLRREREILSSTTLRYYSIITTLIIEVNSNSNNAFE